MADDTDPAMTTVRERMKAIRLQILQLTTDAVSKKVALQEEYSALRCQLKDLDSEGGRPTEDSVTCQVCAVPRRARRGPKSLPVTLDGPAPP